MAEQYYDPATGMPIGGDPQDTGPNVADAYRMGGLAAMDQYMEGPPHEVWGGYDKAVAARDKFANLPEAPDTKITPDWMDRTITGKPAPQLSQQLASDQALAGMFVPQSLGDLGVMFAGGPLAKVAAGGLGYALDATPAEAAGRLPRGTRGRRRITSIADPAEYEMNPRAVMGGNMPPIEARIAPEAQSIASSSNPLDMAQIPSPAAMTPKQAEQAWMQGLPTPKPAAGSTDLPNLRNLPVDEAIAIARNQPHLIKSGEGSEGLYVGGPRELQSKAGLNKIRRDFDKIIADDPRGYDWYDRYRAGLSGTTNNTPLANEWASKMQGQWSAGVDPGSELQFTLKELNSSIAGSPVRANYPAQHEAYQRALAANDPNLLQLGDKTGEYALKVNPDQPGVPSVGTATGVNDFRHARNFTYTETSGEPQKGALTDAGHRFLDYETALAVDRANTAQLGGRSDWTGERLQAAPWVVQKARDMMGRNPALPYEEAMQRALRTITDFFPKHQYFATHEAQPGANVIGHMPGSVDAPQSAKDAYALDPRSSWATAPGGRDAIYGGLGVPGTGAEMRVMPSQPMQGFYTRPDGVTETNLGAVARPLGSFNTPAKDPKTNKVLDPTEPFKSVPAGEQSLLDAGEAVRAYIDAQNAGAWHKVFGGGPNKQSNSLFFPRQGPVTPDELRNIQAAGKPFGLGDAADTGQGVTLTSFYPGAPGGKDFERELRKPGNVFEQFGRPERARVQGGYIGYEDKWGTGGSGDATRAMLEYVNKTPGLRAAFNNNQFLADAALQRMERDKDWAAQWGAPRQDVQNARNIIANSKGDWIDRIEAALKNGAILPATAAALFSGAMAGSLARRAPGPEG